MQVMALLQGLWLRLLAVLLYLAGQGRAARYLLDSWRVWMRYNTSAMDFHLFYCSRKLVELQVACLQPFVTHQ